MALESKQSVTTYAPLLSSIRSLQIGMTQSERQLIAEQLLILLRDYYVHLPIKMSSLGIAPVQQAELLLSDAPLIQTDMEFFRRVMDVVDKLRDRHTTFRLPEPWASMIAYLPFAVEDYWESGQRKLVVTKVLDEVADSNFVPGVEITHWNGVQIAQYVENFSWEMNGGNPYARIAIALRSLTVRSLGYMLPPDEDWVTVNYCSNGANKAIALPWRVISAASSPATNRATTQPSGSAALVQGVDKEMLIVNGAWQDLFSAQKGSSWPSFYRLYSGSTAPPPIQDGNVVCASVNTPDGTFGYVRIFSFEAPDPGAFVDQLSRAILSMPENGLIIDLRDNPGGTIPAGEGLLQLFSDKPVSFSPVCFRITDATQRIVGAIPDFAAWRRSFNVRYETGDVFSQGYPLTVSSDQHRIYRGPVVLIIDSLCYSTTDFFCSGMQDNGLARIIGVDPVTGAGGANVWTLQDLLGFVAASGGTDIKPLPRGADIHVALRRSLRVRSNDGFPVEGLGVTADVVYQLSKRDLLEKNVDLINYAGHLLTQM